MNKIQKTILIIIFIIMQCSIFWSYNFIFNREKIIRCGTVIEKRSPSGGKRLAIHYYLYVKFQDTNKIEERNVTVDTYLTSEIKAMVQSNVDWDMVNSGVLTTGQTSEGVTTINIQMPFRPNKPVYRVVLAEFQAMASCIMKVEHAYHPEGYNAYRPNILGWHCKEIPPSERKSTRK